ncbi:phosphohistidine phosphatase SixA [Thiohalorhabdus methylotrophus]|uniref:Phosphohistidine phosphatase SixA n=1 Tax=Thiohalorhabdus methylotrophus TaxID=3242694 RepID=A0ABV4TQM9_9GAMM
MRIYLMQHGEALSKEADPDRPLSERGTRDVRAIASFLGQARVVVEGIHHSGKTRARHTAELVGEQVAPGLLPEAVSGLGPDDPAPEMAQEIGGQERDLLLVGHLPFLGRLAGTLVVGGDAKPPVGFQPGSVVCLEHAPDGGWQVAWMVRPELVR